MVRKRDRLCLLKMRKSRHVCAGVVLHEGEELTQQGSKERVRLIDLVPDVKLHIQGNLVVPAPSCVELFPRIPDPFCQDSLDKAVYIFIFFRDLKGTVFDILQYAVQTFLNLLSLFFCQDPLFCEHCRMSLAPADILPVKSPVKSDGCIELIDQPVCLFCKPAAPELCHNLYLSSGRIGNCRVFSINKDLTGGPLSLDVVYHIIF